MADKPQPGRLAPQATVEAVLIRVRQNSSYADYVLLRDHIRALELKIRVYELGDDDKED